MGGRNRARREAAAADERAALILESITDAFPFARFRVAVYLHERCGPAHHRIHPFGELVGKSRWDVFPAGVGTIVEAGNSVVL